MQNDRGVITGKSVLGGSTHEKNIELLSKDQKKFLSDILGSETKDAKKAYSDFLKKSDSPDVFSRKDLDKFLRPAKDTYGRLMQEGDDEAAFKTGVVDPMMQQYKQQVLPGLQQRFVDANAGSSSALNQALASSANDLTTQMGQMYLPFKQSQQQTQLAAAGGLTGMTSPMLQYQGQQYGQYNQANANRMSALSGLGGLAGQQTFTPLISQQSGIMGPLIGAGGAIGAAAMLSSEKVKENIIPYNKGLEIIKDLDVKHYDYKKEVGGAKNKIGVIAETLPDEICSEMNGIRCVDAYGLISLLINSVKQLNEKIERLEAAK